MLTYMLNVIMHAILGKYNDIPLLSWLIKNIYVPCVWVLYNDEKEEC